MKFLKEFKNYKRKLTQPFKSLYFDRLRFSEEYWKQTEIRKIAFRTKIGNYIIAKSLDSQT